MKKIITSQNFIKKGIITIIIVLLLSFAVPVKSQASIGGLLLDPLFDLAGTILDTIVGGLQWILVDGELNNSEDGDLLNPFLVKPDAFKSDTDGKYKEFKEGETKTEKEIKEEELDSNFWGEGTYYIPVLKYSPQKIFAGQIPALDINFINPKNWEEDNQENGQEMNKRSAAYQLHDTVASWYVALRNLAMVGLMLVLVYVGIRIVVSSTAADKSKYKQMLMDWLIALCILFFLHYLMSFTTTIVTEITAALNGGEQGNGNNIHVKVTGESEGVEFNTDLMGLIRFKMQAPTVWLKVLYLIFYIAMVIYTCLFTFVYLKRVLIMAFLTIIAPLVALTYPIDKLRDGNAQAFNMWFKEYVFNALIQPFHLIIYTVFVGTAVDLAADNPLFAIVTLAFIIPAEKILRKFFGFEKASTGGALSSFAGIAGGSAAFNMVSKALNPMTKKGGQGALKGSKAVKTRQPLDGDVAGLVDALGGPTGGSPEGGTPSSSMATGIHTRSGEVISNESIGPHSSSTMTGANTPSSGTEYNLSDNLMRGNTLSGVRIYDLGGNRFLRNRPRNK